MATNNTNSIAVCRSASEVLKAANAGKRWVIYLEYSGYNGKNVSGSSHKFWELSGEGTKARARWGRIGSNGQSQAVAFHTGLDRLDKKFDKGYTLALAA